MEPTKNTGDPLSNGSLSNSDNNSNNPSSEPDLAVSPVPITAQESESIQPISPSAASFSAQPTSSSSPFSATNNNPVLGVPVVGQPALSSPGYANQSPLSPLSSGKSSKKKLLIGALLALLLVGGSVGYVFAFYIPNQPANVYQTGLSRSGDSLNKLVTKITAEDRLQKLENSEITATATAKGGDFSFDGTFGVKLSKTKSDGSLDVKIKSGTQPEEALNLKFLTDLPANKQYPSLYFQVNGLKNLGLDMLSPEIAAYEGKWIAVDSDYLESLYSGQSAPKNKENITSAEVASMVRTFSNTSNEYLFTADKNKAVLENKAFIGKESVDGLSTYHYQVGINKAHAKDYCQAVSVRVISEPLYKKMLNLDDQGIADQKKSIAADCDDAVKSIKDNTTLDMWIDAKYKLIHKIRIYDENDKGVYTDIGQTYSGGDNISFFVAYHKEASKIDVKFTTDVDLKSYTSKGTFTWTQKQPENIDAKITFEAKPYNGDVKADKPAGAINIQDVLAKFGIDATPVDNSSPSSFNSVQSKAKDTERTTDIKAIYGQLEAFYAQNAYYPNFDSLNSGTWRAKNMKGLDSEALRDPDGTGYTLATTPNSKQYGYIATQCTAAQCQAYTLSAVLSDGTKYTKQNLN